MKATVLESFEGRSVVLAEDGLFYSIEGSYQTGEIIEYTEKADINRYSIWRKALLQKAAAVAACLILLLSGTIYSYQNFMVYAYVTLDGAMPVKCSLNRKNEVIKIEAVNEDGDALAEDMIENGLKGQKIETAIEYAEKYIETHSDDTAGQEVTITVDCRNETDKNMMEKSLNQKNGEAAESGKGKDSGGDAGNDHLEKGTLKEPAGNKAGTDDSGNKPEKESAGTKAPERVDGAGSDDAKAPDPPDNGGGQNGRPHNDPPREQ